MAVLVEGISVIVKVDAIQKKINDGWEGFKKLVPNNTLSCDNEIAQVGFMTPEDVKRFVDKLESLGLVFEIDEEAQDIAVAEQQYGISTKCSWLEYGHINLDGDLKKKIAACRLVGSTEDQIFMPDGWAFERSLSSSYGFTPTEHQEKTMKFLRHEDGVDVYISELTGKEVYVGRTGES